MNTRPNLITIVGGPGAACEGDACLPSELSATEPDAVTEAAVDAQESRNTAVRNAR